MATRHGHPGPAETHSRERFLEAALTILVRHGVAGLTVRNLAEAAGSSTIGVYARFGGRTGVLDALYERAFELLHQEFVRLPERTGRTADDILTFARAYRRFALESPARYGFMFERTAPGFDPDPNLRAHAQQSTFDLLVDRVRAAAPSGMTAQIAGYLVWTSMHGLVSVELTHRERNAPPGWFLDPGDDSYSDVFTEGITAVMRGLGVSS